MATSDKNGPLLELIPEAQLKPQVPKVYGSEPISTYKFRSAPTLNDLHQMTEETRTWSIWQENDTLIVTDGVVEELHGHLRCSDHHLIRLTDGDKCLSFFSGSLFCSVVGKSDEAIAETAAFLWSLDVENEFACIRTFGETFDFSVVSLDQLRLLFQPPPRTRPLIMTLSNISPAQSVFLARYEYPMYLEFMHNSFSSNFSDGGEAFVESLLERRSWFGNLFLEAEESDVFYRLLQVKAINTLEVKFSQETSQDVPLILSASAKRLKFRFHAIPVLDVDWSTVDIVPKDLAIWLPCSKPIQCDFTVSLLRRIAEVRNLVKLDFELYYSNCVPAMITEALKQAVDGNQSLMELQVRQNVFECTEEWEALLKTMEHHESLRRFVVNTYPKDIDPDYSMLKQLIKRNQYIEVIACIGGRPTDGDEVDRLYAFNHFFRNLRHLKRLPLSFLSTLVGTILINSAGNDFPRSALVIGNHTDALCELIQYAS
jgi:hypothetical protein